MRLELSDVIHYYLGATMQVQYSDGIVEFEIMSVTNNMVFGEDPKEKDSWYEFDLSDAKKLKAKLLLKDARYITPEERAEYKRYCHNNFFKDGTKWETDTPMSIHWLLKNRFDVFDLFERGLAIITNQLVKSEFTSDETKAEFPRANKVQSKFIVCPVCSGSGIVSDMKTGKERPCVVCKSKGEVIRT